MDKTEYQQKLDELQGFLKVKDYTAALELVNEIDWKKVKSVRTLNMVADVYEVNKDFEKCRYVLNLALNRSSIGKSILYRLTEVCIKQRDIKAAQEYYSQYIKLASRDNGKLLLEYKLAKVTKKSLEEQIRILEEYKEREYTERWSYELALLYSKAGDERKCVDACDDMILWFSEGKYVLKAMELKQKYRPLSPSQQAYFDKEQKNSTSAVLFQTAQIEGLAAFEKPKKEENVIDKMNRAVSEVTKDVSADSQRAQQLTDNELEKAPVTSHEFIGGHPDLKKQLEKSIQSIQDYNHSRESAAGEPVKARAEKDASDDISIYNIKIDNTIVDSIRAESAKAEEVTSADAESAAADVSDVRTDEVQLEAAAEINPAAEKESAAEEQFDDIKIDSSIVDSIQAEGAKAADGQIEAEEATAVEEQTADIQIDNTIVDSIQAEGAKAADADISDVRADEVLSEVAAEIKPVAEEEPAAEERTDDIQIDNIMDDTQGEASKAADSSAEKIEEKIESLPTKDTDEVDIEKLLAAISGELSDEPKKPEAASAEPVPTPEPAAAPTPAAVSKEAAPQPEEAVKAALKPEEPVKAAPKVVLDDREIPDPEPTKEERLTHTIPLDKVGMNTIPISLEEAIKSETPEERRIRILNNAMPTRMSDAQRQIFTYFARIPGMDSQILNAMSSVYEYAGEHTSKHGNLAIMGAVGTGKSRLSEGLITAMCKDMGLEVAKTARIKGDKMNGLDPAKVVDRMAGGFLIIENAGDMTSRTIDNLNKAMEFRTDCMILLIEDEKTAMRALLSKYPEFAKKFSSTISIPVFTNDELVAFARTYCAENKYQMDELGVLALYSLISSGQTEDHPMTISEVKEILDSAMSKAKKGGRRGRKSSNKDKTIILYEKDFS